MSGPTASARFEGSVQGVVVHAQSSVGCSAVGSSIWKAHGERGILALAIRVVEARLEVRERRLRGPRVGQHALGLVDETLVPELLEGPDDALHVGEVHRLVVVAEIDPARLAGDVALPFVRVAHHRLAAVLVEARDPELEDLRATADAELLLRLHLGGQPVTVPAEAALDAAPAHRLVAGHDVLHEAGDEGAR